MKQLLAILLIGLMLPLFSLQAQSPILLYDVIPSEELQRYYQQRGVQSYSLTNYRVYKGDTLSRGVYKYMEFDPFGRIVYDSTATAMGRQYRYLYNERGALARISKRTIKGDGYILVRSDSLDRKVEEIEISHRLDTNEVRYYRYDEDGHMIEKEAVNPATTTLTSYQYNQQSQLEKTSASTTTIKGEIETGTIYLRNAQGNITGIRELKDGNVRQVDNYLYNTLGQVNERRLPGKGEYYRYYYNGRGLLQRIEVYDINRHTLKGWQEYEYQYF
ncbi:MAG: hypothetical protein AAFP02_00385 [Bacteroidota bacterium]